MPHDMTSVARLVTHFRTLAHRYRTQLILALRVTVSAILALALAQWMHLRLPLWAVLTSLIVTQMSLGRSLQVAIDYLMGTFAGVAYGGALAILIPHDSEWSLLAVLALAIAPLAFIAAFKANFNVLPITAIIVLLVPSMQHVSPMASALDRVLEVTVGGVVGFVVSFLCFPRARTRSRRRPPPTRSSWSPTRCRDCWSIIAAATSRTSAASTRRSART
jgi:uncharacterized membrane protein YgaE (UPF0421/DUF939 family)